METIKKFQVNAQELSEKEKLVLEKLIKACELISPLYEKQKNSEFPGANFYPKDVSKEEIEQAAKRNPLLLHPYTFVEKDRWGRLVAVPFCVKFKKELIQIAKILGEAAKISEDKDFGRYLNDLARALLKNDYAQNEILWVGRGPFKFSFIIGPVERYLDKLFFKKCAYQAWLGIIDDKRTQAAKKFKQVILSSRRKILPGTSKIEIPEMEVEINKTLCFSGLIADTMFTGTNLPNDVNLMSKFGSKLVIFEGSLDEKFEKDQLPACRAIFEKKLQESYSKEELYDGSLACILSHEIAHSLIRYEDAEERLGNLFPVLDEILAYIFGIRTCAFVFLKGAISQKQLEAILMMHICRNFVWWLDSKKNPDVINYAIGGAIAQNFFLKEGGLKRKNDFYIPDFIKLLISIDNFSRVLEYYLSSGSYDEVKQFIEEYSSFEAFKGFS